MAVGTSVPVMDTFEDAADDSGIGDAVLHEALEANVEDLEEEEDEHHPLYEESEDSDEEEDSEDEAEDDEDDEEEEDSGDEPEDSEPKSRSQKRIQSLVAEKKELQAQQEAIRRQFEEQYRLQQRQIEEVNRRAIAQEEAARKQAEFYEKQLQYLSAQEEKQMQERDPVAAYEKKLVNDAYQRARAELLPEIETLKQKFESQQAQQQQAVQQAQAKAAQQERFSFYEQQAQEVIYNLYPDAKDDPEFYSDLEETLMAMSAAYGELPKAVAPQFQKLATRLASKQIKKAGKQSGQRIKAAKKLPGKSRKSNSASDGTGIVPRPSYAKLKEAGYKDYFEWREADCPPLD